MNNVAVKSILIKFTHVGDTDLDGCVDDVDYAALLAGMSGAAPTPSPNTWIEGDIDFNGVVDQADLDWLNLTLNNATYGRL